jgi:hypothetical protein
MWVRWIGIALVIGACGEEPPKPTPATATASASGDVKPAKADGEDKPAPKDEEARGKNTVTFASTKIPAAGFTLVHTEAAKRTMSTGNKGYRAVIVDLANYDRQGGTYLPNPSKEGQVRITLNFSGAGEPVAGTYALDAPLGKENRLSVGIHAKFEHVGVIKGTGQGEITHIDSERVQGKVSVKDDQGTSIEATFDVPYSSESN